jgi:hypothetical protein
MCYFVAELPSVSGEEKIETKFRFMRDDAVLRTLPEAALTTIPT